MRLRSPVMAPQPIPVLAAQEVEDNDDEPEVILEKPIFASALHAPVQMPAHQPAVRLEQSEENGDEIEYIVLD
ncbi:unnamed protein product [Caenorhabditis brenneri]